jgi:hypothetical protein
LLIEVSIKRENNRVSGVFTRRSDQIWSSSPMKRIRRAFVATTESGPSEQTYPELAAERSTFIAKIDV